MAFWKRLAKFGIIQLFEECRITLGDVAPSGTVTRKSVNLGSGVGLASGLGRIQIVDRITPGNVAITSGVAAISQTAVKAATALTTAAQVITTFAAQPDVPRVLRFVAAKTGATAIGDGTFTGATAKYVIAVGTDINDQVITEWVPLNDTTAVNSVKAFKTVTSITLPIRANTDGGDTVSAGYGIALALRRPVRAAADLVEYGVKASAATAYTITTLPTSDVGEATTTINEELSSSDTTITILSATGWVDGSQRSMAVIEHKDGTTEEVIITSRTTTALTVVRGANGTTAKAAAKGTQISWRPGMTISPGAITANDRFLMAYNTLVI